MAKLFCALVGAAGNAFSVRVDEGDSVDELKKAIKGEKQRTITCDPDGLDLYLAKKGDAWLTENEVKGVSDIDGLKHLDVARAKLRRVGLSNDQVGEEDEDVDAAGHGPVNVLVLIPPEEEQPSHKKVKIVKASSVIKDEDINFIEKNLDIEVWQVGGGISLGIGRVESDFPEWFYVRKETLDIIQVFKDKMEAKLHIVFVGTPGVGKSMLVVLFAFYMALRQKKRVVLFRKKKGEGFSMLYLDTENNNCWRMDAAEIGDLDRQFLQGAELCLDGLRYDDIDRYFGKLGGFRLLATSVHYPMKNDDIPVLRRCLVPFWSSVDLNAIGAHLQWSKHEIKDRYFYSGGNLRDFLSEKIVVMDSIDQAVDLIDLPVAELLNTQYAVGSARQIDRLRMTGIRANDQSDLDKYMTSRSWCCVVTSEYALRQLGKIVEASYCEVLWSKGRMLADDGLMDIAFENYVHTRARDGKKIRCGRTTERKRYNIPMLRWSLKPSRAATMD